MPDKKEGDLEEKIDKVNHKFAEESDLPAEIHALQRRYSPSSFYNDLMTIAKIVGMNDNVVMARAKEYEDICKRTQANIKYYWEKKNEKSNM